MSCTCKIKRIRHRVFCGLLTACFRKCIQLYQFFKMRCCDDMLIKIVFVRLQTLCCFDKTHFCLNHQESATKSQSIVGFWKTRWRWTGIQEKWHCHSKKTACNHSALHSQCSCLVFVTCIDCWCILLHCVFQLGERPSSEVEDLNFDVCCTAFAPKSTG